MTSPDGAIPTKSLTGLQIHQMQDYTQTSIAEANNEDMRDMAETARVAFLGTVLGGFLNVASNVANGINQFISDLLVALRGATGGLIDLTGWLDDVDTTATTAAVQVADLSEIAVTSVTTPIWVSTGGGDIATFPRMLMQPVASGISVSGTTGGSDGTGFHSHSFAASSGITFQNPYYKPGKRVLDLFFIRCDRRTDLTRFKCIMGGDGLFGIDDMFLMLYGVDPTTNVLSKLWDSGDISSTIGGNARKQVNLDMGVLLEAQPGHVFAAGQLQIAPGGVQQTRTIAGLMQTNIQQAAGEWPTSPGAYLANQSTAPATINMSALTFVDDKVGWFALAP
jgi:hypothetical protein